MHKRNKGADGKLQAVPVFATVKAWAGYRLFWRVCVVQVISLITTTPHGVTGLLSSVSMQREEVGSKMRQTLLFSPWKKKCRKIHPLLLSLTKSVIKWPRPARGSPFVTEIIPVPAAATPHYTRVVWLKKPHIWQKVCPFLRTSTVNSPGASPRGLIQMQLSTGKGRQVQPTLQGSCGEAQTATWRAQSEK